MEIEIPSEPHYMDGEIPLEHFCMEDDYMEIENPLEHHDMDGSIPLGNHYMDDEIPLEHHFMDVKFICNMITWRMVTWRLEFLQNIMTWIVLKSRSS